MEHLAQRETDKRLGVAIVLGVVAIVGALAMLSAPGDLVGAVGFGLAVLAGIGLVVAVQLS